MASAAPRVKEISRQDLKVAVAKAVELRALHASLLQGSNNSPSCFRLPAGASPSLNRVSNSNQLPAEEYPVFTPSYEEEPLPGHRYVHSKSQILSETWSGIELEGGEDEGDLGNDRQENNYSFMTREEPNFTADDQKSNTSSCVNHVAVLQTSPITAILKRSRRTGSADFKTISTCNTCKPAAISKETDGDKRNPKSTITTGQVSDTQSSLQMHQKSRGTKFSWLFPKLKKKSKSEMSPTTVQSEDMSQLFKDWGLFSVESLKKEVLEANENRDAALAEVGEMRTSLGELTQKLLYLETYCEELKKALKQAVQGKDPKLLERQTLITKRTKFIGGSKDDSMPVSHEVMVEGFLQIVSEARLSAKQFCKTLINQIKEIDCDLIEKLNLLLHPHHLTMNSRYSKEVLYHLEALTNQCLYQDFENCVFQKNGTPKFLDPQHDQQENFSDFVALRNLSWNEVLRKGTKYYSEEFSKFCDQKMSCVVSLLDWSRPWPEQLLQSFFVAAKCIWLLHLLAFSFSPPLAILRVDENRNFDPLYMEDILADRQRAPAPARVKIMVMPGFYVHDRVLKCKVLCRYRTVA